MSNDKTQERAAFEAWAKNLAYPFYCREALLNGGSVDRYSGIAWDAWQARAALSSRPVQGGEQIANCIAAGPTATDVALWQAMNEAEKYGLRTDDKLIRQALNERGYYLVRSLKKPGTCEDMVASAPAREPMTEDEIKEGFKPHDATYSFVSSVWSFGAGVRFAEIHHGICKE